MISEEEYEVLKGLEDKWKWIARDGECNSLNVFSVKPIKIHSQWDYIDVGYKHARLTKEESKMLQFIQWEDEEPHNIAWLLGEYEEAQHGYFNNELYERFCEESEETEVKSKQELIEKWELAIEAADFYGKGKEGRLIGYMKDFVSDLNQLDPERNPEVDQHKELLDELNDLYARKNQDYGNSFDESLDEDGLLVLKIRLGDKYKRFSTLINQKNEVIDESMRDTLIDLANYALMGVMWMDKNEEEE